MAKTICSLVLAATGLCFVGALNAMQIVEFDKLAAADQSDYVVLLIEGAQKVLIDEGKDDLAIQIHNLFTNVPPGDDAPLGTNEFELNLAQARLIDLERLAKDPHATRLEVEHAFIITLKKNGIVLPKSFMAVGTGFKPKHPTQQR